MPWYVTAQWWRCNGRPLTQRSDGTAVRRRCRTILAPGARFMLRGKDALCASCANEEAAEAPTSTPRSATSSTSPRLGSAHRIVIAGGPRTGKTTLSRRLANELGATALHTDDLIAGNDWSTASAKAAGWFGKPAPWVIEGVATIRALRKWMRSNAGKPCDRLIWIRVPKVQTTDKQQAMAKGCATVFAQVRAELVQRGVEIETR